ncbi:MAG: helix-turn-helix domain-containing protein [Mogibacterium sp.]|nr:helix-turn-helix domain-containing protein [Mogibacterium sp.]
MNFYREVRDRLGLTREQASELLETIEAYKIERIESEKQLPSPEDVMIMAEKYCEPNIRNYYCANQCPMGQHFVPVIKFNDLEKTVIKLVASLNSMNSKKNKLIEIAEDGKITDDEMLDFISIQKDLERVSLAVDALELWTEKMMSSGVIDMEKYKELINK